MFKTIQTDAGFHVNLLSGNHRVLCTSKVCDEKSETEAIIAAVRANAWSEDNYVLKNGEVSGKPYYTIKNAHNGKILMTSEHFETTQARKRAISTAKQNSQSQKVIFVDKRSK